jgi:opine dehydrogenase
MEQRKLLNYCIIGAGHGGQALAAYIRYLGNQTVLYNRTKMVIDQIRAYGGVELQGMINTKVSGLIVTSSLKEALELSEIIMICIPAHAHQDIAINMAPYLKDHHIIVINPGRTLGASMFAKHLREAGFTLDIPIIETDTFVLTSRKIRPGISQVYSRKKVVQVAGLTPAQTEIAHAKLIHSFPMMKKAESMVVTSLNNLGMIFHPFAALMNIARIENEESYLHYKEGITPSIAKFLEKLDEERLALARFFGVELHSAQQWLGDVYGVSGNSLYDTLQNTKQYDEIIAPTDVNTRYVFEDIPTGIVPFLELSKLAKTPNTHLQLVLDLANMIYGIDFTMIGRNEVQDFYDLYKKE